MRFKDKVAIVTGSSSGIGRAIALGFGKEGANVVVNGQNSERIEKVVAEIRAMGSKAIAAQASVANEAEVNNMVKKTLDQFGKIDILVNCAAYLSPDTSWWLTPFSETKPSDWDKEISVTFKGVLLCCSAVIPHMMRQECGNIINITSGSAQSSSSRGLAVYTGCKGGIAAFSRIIANELIPHGIRVNCVSPGAIETPLWDRMPPMYSERVKATPLGLGQPEDMANLVLFLASDEAKYIIGQNWGVNGGAIMNM